MSNDCLLNICVCGVRLGRGLTARVRDMWLCQIAVCRLPPKETVNHGGLFLGYFCNDLYSVEII